MREEEPESSQKEKIEWVEVARRGENHNLLFIDLVMRTYLRNLCGKTFGERVEFLPKHYRQFAGARWFSREDYGEYVRLLKKACQSGRILEMGADYESQINQTRNYAEKMRGKNLAEASSAQLEKEMAQFFEVAIRHWGHAYHYLFLNRVLPDEVTAEVAGRVPEVKKQNEILLTLFASDKPTEMREENIALLELAEKMREQKNGFDSEEAKKLIEIHLERYAHLGRYYFRSQDYYAGQIRERIEHLSAEEVAAKKLDFEGQKKIPEKTRQIIAELALPEQTAMEIWAIKQFAFCSNHADETYNYLVSSCAPLLKAVCKKLDCSWNELVSMQSTEILEALAKGLPLNEEFKKELRERFKDHAIILENGEISVLAGAELKKYYEREQGEQQQYTHLQELKGTPASPGKAAGRVALVLTSSEISKVKKGDILVTGMTTPEFVPAMERAAAIVTDDGGVLCHAAIVSRELHRPCVVGTRYATRALQDGELVEVDAETGVVKKVSQ